MTDDNAALNNTEKEKGKHTPTENNNSLIHTNAISCLRGMLGMSSFKKIKNNNDGKINATVSANSLLLKKNVMNGVINNNKNNTRCRGNLKNRRVIERVVLALRI
jgi:hypothetical protein